MTSTGLTTTDDVLWVEPFGPPRGELRVDGAKNSALPLIICALLVEEGTTTIRNVPRVEDVRLLLQILEGLGAGVDTDWRQQTVTIDASRLHSDTPDPALVGRLRGSLMLMAPLLIRLGSCRMSRPGGCSIGTRKFDIHLDGLRRLGAEVHKDGRWIRAVCAQAAGNQLLLDLPTHTGTQQLILAAVRAEGTTTICNASQEPEVAQLCRSLVHLGARISGIGTTRLTIEGVKQLRGGVITSSPSRLETSLFAMAGCLPGGHLVIRGAAPEAEPVLVKLREMGAHLEFRHGDVLEVIAPPRLSRCKVSTWPYPGFPTDAQPHFMALACYAEGRSLIRENLYEDRFRHAEELRRMGAAIHIRRESALIDGPCPLFGVDVTATDLQAGAALLLAALGARGTTYIHGFGHLVRGYPDLVGRLQDICKIGTCVRADRASPRGVPCP